MKKHQSDKRLTAISMFSGCGGMDLGFIKAGFEMLWANDFNSDSCETYRKNIEKMTGTKHLVEGGIESISRPSKKSLKNLTVLLGGFPCQAYSNAGQRKSVGDHRGELYKYCLEFIDAYQPEYVVFENVRGLLSIQGRKKKLIEEIADELLDLNYDVYIKLLNASNYGVPQNRLRTFIVAVKRKQSKVEYRFPSQIQRDKLSLKHILKIPRGTPNQKDVVSLNPQAYEIGNLVPEGGSWKNVPYDKLPERLQKIRDNMRKYRWPNFYRRFSRDEIAGTITAAFKPENAGVWHPTKPRTFTAREIARIQSFDDEFVFYGSSVKKIYEMIGNAVPPLLAKSVAESIIDSIEGIENLYPIRDYHDVKAKKKPIRPDDVELAYCKAAKKGASH